jgi:hypothetical protein
MLCRSGKTYCGIFSLIVSLFVITAVSGCTSSHQVLEYSAAINTPDNLIPGIEPEESARKILIAVKGIGLEPENGTIVQKKFMAERAAVIDGYRKLAERLAGIIVRAETKAGKNTISVDEVLIETNAYLRGAQVSGIKTQNGFAVADVKVYLEPRQTRFYNGPLGSQKLLDALPGATVGAAIGAGVAEAFSGVAAGEAAAAGAGIGALIF